MKVKDIVDLLKTDYIVLSGDENTNQTKYIYKRSLGSDILESELKAIEPVVAVKKTIFDSNAGDNDFVSAIKIVTTDEVVKTAEAEETYEDIHREQRQSYNRPNFNQGPFNNPFGNFNMDFLNNIMTPEMIQGLMNSDFMKEMMKPENISQIFSSQDFQNFLSNMDIGDMLSKMSSSSRSPAKEEDEEEYEYEEYDYDDYDDDDFIDDDEYEEI